jgi:NAD(P)-dependent dehydrogenase (short-subunit alcohol dehydrogenase family)
MPAAIVTGGSRGIGLAIARELASRGFDLVLAARTERELLAARDALASAFSVRCIAQPADVSDPDQAQGLVDRAVKDLGRLDGLVNNAGVAGAIGELAGCDLRGWRSAIEVNLMGTMHMMRAAIPQMRRQGGGRMVNLAGGGVGGAGVLPCISGYVASKAAVVQLTECIAREVAQDGIYLNAISPGPVVTEMTAGVIAAGPEKAGRELYQRTLQQRDSGGEPPERAARLVAWLLSPAAKDLTGKLLSAVWDDVSRIDPAADNRSSLYTLRRIEGTLFQEVRRK